MFRFGPVWPSASGFGPLLYSRGRRYENKSPVPIALLAQGANDAKPFFLVQLEDTPLRSIRKAAMLHKWSLKMPIRKIGRDARTGEFIPVKEAVRRPSTTTVETIKPKPGSKPNPKKPKGK